MLKDIVYEKGDISYPYILHLPEGYDASKKYPFILFLHGMGQRGNNFEHYKIALPKMLKQGYTREAIIVCPQCAGDATWNTQIPQVKEFLCDMMEKYNADEDRVLITGLSMGAYGTWELIQMYPDIFAAAGPICGGGIPWRYNRLTKMPIRVYHGLDDDLVPHQCSEQLVDSINKAGGIVEYFPLPGVKHNSWDYAYEQAGLIDWLLEHKKA